MRAGPVETKLSGRLLWVLPWPSAWAERAFDLLAAGDDCVPSSALEERTLDNRQDVSPVATVSFSNQTNPHHIVKKTFPDTVSSFTNPSQDSPLEYFRSKATLEKALMESGLSYSILRPTVLFGREDVLVNNIAWLLLRFPFFGVFGDGSYRLQPMYVDDMAKLAVEEGLRTDNRVVDAIGPETFTYRELVAQIGRIIQKPRPISSVPPAMGHLVGWAVGKIVGDVVITRAEIAGLMAGLLCTNSKPTGETSLTEWASAHRDTLGVRYASELGRRKDRTTSS